MTDSEKINKVRKVLQAAISNTKGEGAVRKEKTAMRELLETLLGRKPSADEISLASMV